MIFQVPQFESLKFTKNVTLLFSLLISGVALLFVLERGQDRNWDLLNYHYFTGYSLLSGRYLTDIAASNLQSFFNPMANMVAYLSMRYLPFPFSAWSILAIQLLSIPAIVLISREVARGLGYVKLSLAEVIALILCILSPLWWSEAGTTFFSSSTTPLMLWGLYFLLREFSEAGPVKFGVELAGFMFGFAVGLKLTNAPFAVAAATSLFYLTFAERQRWTLVKNLYFILFGALGFLLTAWWNLYLWQTWGSPLFPLYNHIFKSPFADFSSWRDMRWYFSSLSDFFGYLVQSAIGTGKTSEVPFADPRLLITGSLLPGALLCNSQVRSDRRVIAFLLFSFVGFILWAVLFAYQRYLIPFELVLGLVIWILVIRLVKSERFRIVVMAAILAITVSLIRVPDWGHAIGKVGAIDPFEISLPENLASTPARYLVFGVPISYILPFLHFDSEFFGVGFNPEIDDVIRKRLGEKSNLPVRILARDSDAQMALDKLRTFGFNKTSNSLECDYFQTGVGRYITCLVRDNSTKLSPSGLVADIQFSKESYLRSTGVLWESGLSSPEPWGRWSHGNLVEFGFLNCLPQGTLQVVTEAHAFGPNVNAPIEFTIGHSTKTIFFGDMDKEVVAIFKNEELCADRLQIRIPKSISPKEFGSGTDTRVLGIGFVRLKVIIQ